MVFELPLDLYLLWVSLNVSPVNTVTCLSGLFVPFAALLSNCHFFACMIEDFSL